MRKDFIRTYILPRSSMNIRLFNSFTYEEETDSYLVHQIYDEFINEFVYQLVVDKIPNISLHKILDSNMDINWSFSRCGQVFDKIVRNNKIDIHITFKKDFLGIKYMCFRYDERMNGNCSMFTATSLDKLGVDFVDDTWEEQIIGCDDPNEKYLIKGMNIIMARYWSDEDVAIYYDATTVTQEFWDILKDVLANIT